MDAARPDGLWSHAAVFLTGTGHHPSRLLVLATALVALAAVASSRIWPVARTVVTIAHEGGHALMALLTGRRVSSVRVLRSTAGVTVSEGNPAGPGVVLTAAAGYLAPPLLGLGAAALLATGHVAGMLVLSLALLAALAVAVRNAYGLLAVVIIGAAIAIVLWRASALGEYALGYALTWFLLFGGVRPVLELQRARRRKRTGRTDADQLAVLTRVPAGVWIGLFGMVALCALAVSAFWLVGQ
ncbi:MAG TPA: M50 family metallopeptidase [Streptosporangiaceae bacterium]|nr:M50 family metallopeptidase [Streptosporangiaceae bacterium]